MRVRVRVKVDMVRVRLDGEQVSGEDEQVR